MNQANAEDPSFLQHCPSAGGLRKHTKVLISRTFSLFLDGFPGEATKQRICCETVKLFVNPGCRCHVDSCFLVLSARAN